MAEESLSTSFSTKRMRCNAGPCLSPPLASVSTRHCGTLYLANGACHEQSDCQERRRNSQKQGHQGFPGHDSVTFLFNSSILLSAIVWSSSGDSSLPEGLDFIALLLSINGGFSSVTCKQYATRSKAFGIFWYTGSGPGGFLTLRNTLCFKEPLRFYGQRTTSVAFRNSKATPTLCGCSKQNASSSFNLPSMVAGVMGSASGRRKGGNVVTVLRK